MAVSKVFLRYSHSLLFELILLRVIGEACGTELVRKLLFGDVKIVTETFKRGINVPELGVYHAHKHDGVVWQHLNFPFRVPLFKLRKDTVGAFVKLLFGGYLFRAEHYAALNIIGQRAEKCLCLSV